MVITHELGHVTLGHRSIRYPSNLELFTLRRNELEANQRGVEIMALFLGLTHGEAANRYAAYLVTANRARQGRAVALPLSHFHPAYNSATCGAAWPSRSLRLDAKKTSLLV